MPEELTTSQSQQAVPFVKIRLDASAVMAMLGQAPQVTNAEIARGLEEIGAAFEPIGASEAPEGALGASGGLRGSVYHQLRGTPIRVVEAGWAAPYAEYVDRGRRPGHWPPEAPIALWARKVLNVPEERLASAVFAIRRKIGTRGTRGTPFAMRTMLRMQPIAQRALDQAAERIAGRLSK
jgi:hypothetical protein